MTFDADGFAAWLGQRRYAGAPMLVRYVRWCFDHGVSTPVDVDAEFPYLATNTRSRYRNAMRRYLEYQEVRS